MFPAPKPEITVTYYTNIIIGNKKDTLESIEKINAGRTLTQMTVSIGFKRLHF